MRPKETYLSKQKKESKQEGKLVWEKVIHKQIKLFANAMQNKNRTNISQYQTTQEILLGLQLQEKESKVLPSTFNPVIGIHPE